MDHGIEDAFLDVGLDEAAAAVAELATAVERRLEHPIPELTSVVDRVVVILGSSRGGTSLLYRALHRSGRFASIGGEHTHLYKRAGMMASSMMTGDVLDVDGHRKALGELRKLMSFELDAPAADADGDVLSDSDIMLRATVRAACQDPERIDELWDIWNRSAAERVPAMEHVSRLVTAVGPDLYDSSNGRTPRNFELLRTVVLEEPPFVRPSLLPALRGPRAPHVLLLKASVDAYRIPLLRETFCDLPLEIIYLTRNPYASVNGLIDGWLSPAFQSHRLSSTEDSQEGTQWWKFDLPPGSSLQESVPLRARRQWLESHLHILRWLHLADRHCVVKAEDIMFGDRTSVLGDLIEWLHLGEVDLGFARLIKPVMATRTPEPFRWRARRDSLRELLDDANVVETTMALGYPRGKDALWM